MPTVKLPNGQTASFPDNMAPDDIQKAIESDPNSGAFPAGASGPLPGVPKAPNPMQPPSLMDRAATVLTNAGDAVTGAGKGALHTLSSTDQFARDHLPAVLTNSNMGFGKPADLQHVQQMATPNNTAQKIGYGAEQVGEFMAPGGLEAEGAAKLAAAVPKLGKLALPASRVAAAALSSGAVNKAQGGSFGAGAALGGGGGALSEGFRAAAPIIAESALGIRGADRRAPITPGKAILGETTGINARAIADQAAQKQSLYTGERNALLKTAPPVDLTPTRGVAADAQFNAALRNSPDTIKRTNQLSDLLHTNYGTASAIPPQVSAVRANSLKEGLGDLKNSWNPATPNSFAEGAIGKAYGSLDKSIDAVAPGTSGLNDKISSLFPVASRATATDLNSSALQRILGRFTRPTGALIGGAAGAGYGYEKEGVPGAMLYGAAGVAAPELIGSPTAQMMMARGFSNGATPVVRTMLGGGLQATRNKSLYDSK